MALRKCACIETLFTELPWEQRFKAAKDAGFSHVEFWNWTSKDMERIDVLAKEAGIAISGFNGDEGCSLIDPGHRQPYLEHLRLSLEEAAKVGASSVTIHSNALGTGPINSYDELSVTVKLCAMYGTLLECVKLAEKAGIRLYLEALNTSVDHAGNFLTTTRMGAELCRMVNSPFLKLLYDVYHMQITEGNICDTLTGYLDQIGHIHVADVPGRHEPGTGELNYPHILKHLEAIGYTGLIGYEFFPSSTTENALPAIMIE